MKRKEPYLLVAFGVVLYAALMNFGHVWAALGWAVGLLTPVLAGLLAAFVLSVPMNGFEKLLRRGSDTGCGSPEEDQRSIFQPFFRVDKSRSREFGGAGLGLSLVWEIADLHGGSVWVEESSEKGTTIAVELPAGTENDSSGTDTP